MGLNTNHLRRCIQTLHLSLERLEQAAPESIDHEVFRHAVIKGYELTQEVGFKLIRKALREYGYGSQKLDQTPIKELLRLAATHGLMTIDEVEQWFAYRDNRNDTTHQYGEAFAQKAVTLLSRFIVDAERLEQTLRAKFGMESVDG